MSQSNSVRAPNEHILDANVESLMGSSHNGETVDYCGCILRSVFQPVASVVHGTVVGYEALLRATDRDGEPVPPPVLFESAADSGDLELVNHLVCDLHFANFSRQKPDHCWLFININPDVFCSMIGDGDKLLALTQKYDIAPSRVVIELIENDILDHEDFGHCLAKCKRAGFMIAIDDFGKGFSNFDRIFNFAPSIVKFDMSLVVKGRSNVKLQRAYRHLTTLLHEIDAIVLAEGIETIDDARYMMEAGVDFLQGYWISRPNPLTTAEHVAERMEDLRHCYAKKAENKEFVDRLTRTKFGAAMTRAAAFFADTGDVVGAAHFYLRTPGAARFFVLNEFGIDIGEVTSSHALPEEQLSRQLAPLHPTRTSNFFHRDYFREAIRLPEQLHFVSPIFSFLDATSSNIVVKAINRDGKIFVTCGTYLQQ